jgi:hypothetical protein
MLENLVQTLPQYRHAELRRQLKLLDRTIEGHYSFPEDLEIARIPDSQGLGGRWAFKRQSTRKPPKAEDAASEGYLTSSSASSDAGDKMLVENPIIRFQVGSDTFGLHKPRPGVRVNTCQVPELAEL